jgi:hypothetical protein
MPATARTSNDTLAAFLNTLNDAGLQPGDKVRQLMGYFCPDTPNANPPPKLFPCLGITDHGPAFLGVGEVADFFTQLFQTFPDMQWRDLSPRLTATNEIGIQMDVVGTYSGQWFQHPSPESKRQTHHSLPLSQLPHNVRGNSLGKSASHHNGLPAFAIFSFQERTFKIQQLQIYLDRYAMMESIGLDWTPKGRSAGATQSVRTSSGRRVTITIED